MRNQLRGALVLGAVVVGLVGMAAPARGVTVDRGSTQLLTCDDVASRAQVKDSTKHGIDKTVRNVKAAGIKHEENFLPGDSNAGLVKREPDPNHTPDLGDTDSCSGLLANDTNPWAGNAVPYSPVQQFTGSINEIVKVAGSLTGRSTCDAALVDPSEYALHGKLTIVFGNQASVGSPGTPAKIDTLGKKVQGQVYVTTEAVAPYPDLIKLSGIGIKGMGEGAWYDSQSTYRPPANNLGYAIEACATGLDDQVVDGIVGEPPFGGLVTVITDTDADTGFLGNVLVSPADDVEIADRNNSSDWSI